MALRCLVCGEKQGRSYGFCDKHAPRQSYFFNYNTHADAQHFPVAEGQGQPVTFSVAHHRIIPFMGGIQPATYGGIVINAGVTA